MFISCPLCVGGLFWRGAWGYVPYKAAVGVCTLRESAQERVPEALGWPSVLLAGEMGTVHQPQRPSQMSALSPLTLGLLGGSVG